MSMPADWWPDRIIVRGEVARDDAMLDLCFVVNQPDILHPVVWQEHLRVLREAMWDALHGEEELAAMKAGIARDRAMISAANRSA